MTSDLIDAAKGLLPNDLLSKAAGSLGESEAGIQKALNGAIPSVLAGLLGQSSSAGSGGILDIVKSAAGSGALNNISGLIGSAGGFGSAIMGWLRSLFGDKLNSVVSALAEFAGIRTTSASSVLSMAAPAALGAVGRYTKENNLSAAGLNSFLQSQKSSILGSIPAGLNLAGALGLSSLGDLGGKISGAVSSTTNYTADTIKKGSRNWLWIVILVVTVLLIWLLTSKSGNQEKASAPHTRY